MIVPWTGSPARLEDVIGQPTDAAAARVLGRVRRYVEVETPSGDEAALVRLAELVAADLEAAGAIVERHDAPGLGRNLVAEVPAHEDGAALLAVAHMDTVHPAGTLAAMPFREDGDRVRGPGIYDMKTGLALIVEALSALARTGRRPRRTLRAIITCDEEIGSYSARPLFEAAVGGAQAALVPEPSQPDGGVKTRRKGVSTYRLDVAGQAAHAGIEPEKAVSAVTELAHQVLAALALADPARGTTVNVGVVHGGTASNVVAASGSAQIDVRAWEPDEAARVHRGLLALTPRDPRARVTIARSEHRGPLVRTPDVAGLYERARALAAGLGVDLGEGATGGGSDGSLLAGMGLPVLDGLGPRGAGAHTTDEHILRSDLPFRLALMMRLMETL